MSNFHGNVDACEFNHNLPLTTWLAPLWVIFLTLSLFSSLLLIAHAFTIRIAIMYNSLHQKDTMINYMYMYICAHRFNICFSVIASIPSVASLTSGRCMAFWMHATDFNTYRFELWKKLNQCPSLLLFVRTHWNAMTCIGYAL